MIFPNNSPIAFVICQSYPDLLVDGNPYPVEIVADRVLARDKGMIRGGAIPVLEFLAHLIHPNFK